MTKKHVLIVENEVHADMRVWFVLYVRNVRTLRSDEAVKFVKNYQSTQRNYLKS